MYIVMKEPFEHGARPALQSWDGQVAPDGFALCPDEFHEVFYSTNPAGFVEIEVEDNVVVSMKVNQVALDAYLESLPDLPHEPEPDPEPTQLDRIEAQVAYTALMTDTLLEV